MKARLSRGRAGRPWLARHEEDNACAGTLDGKCPGTHAHMRTQDSVRTKDGTRYGTRNRVHGCASNTCLGRPVAGAWQAKCAGGLSPGPSLLQTIWSASACSMRMPSIDQGEDACRGARDRNLRSPLVDPEEARCLHLKYEKLGTIGHQPTRTQCL